MNINKAIEHVDGPNESSTEVNTEDTEYVPEKYCLL